MFHESIMSNYDRFLEKAVKDIGLKPGEDPDRLSEVYVKASSRAYYECWLFESSRQRPLSEVKKDISKKLRE